MTLDERIVKWDEHRKVEHGRDKSWHCQNCLYLAFELVPLLIAENERLKAELKQSQERGIILEAGDGGV